MGELLDPEQLAQVEELLRFKVSPWAFRDRWGGTKPTDGQVPTYQGGSTETKKLEFATPSGGGAPTDADYLVGTADSGLSNEIVVGTTPGGELGGTWASPTVDGTHSGSAHHVEDHDHDGAPTQQLLAANTHGSASADTHHSQAHTVASHSDTTATGAELETLTDGSETTLHSHAGGGTVSHVHSFYGQATPGQDESAGDAQDYGYSHVAQTVQKIVILCDVAPGTNIVVEIEYNSGEDLDTESWTQIDTITHTGKGSVTTAGFTNAAIPADRILRMNHGSITGTDPQGVKVFMETNED